DPACTHVVIVMPAALVRQGPSDRFPPGPWARLGCSGMRSSTTVIETWTNLDEAWQFGQGRLEEWPFDRCLRGLYRPRPRGDAHRHDAQPLRGLGVRAGDGRGNRAGCTRSGPRGPPGDRRE